MSRRKHTCGAENTVGLLALGSLQLHCFGLVFLISTSAWAGKLGEVRDATEGTEGADDDDDTGDAGDGDDTGDDLGGDLAEEASETVMSAILSAAVMRAESVRFARYPYADGVRGWVVSDAVAPLPSASFRFSMDYAYDWEQVHRPALALSLDTSSGFGLRADYTNYVERLPEGAHDYLGIGSLDAMFRMVDATRVALYFGLGWRYVPDNEALVNGFNSLLAIDIFPVRPLVVSAIAEGGNLGAAGFFHGRVTLGALIQRLEIFIGYDAVVIGDGRENPIVFHGPLAGIRGWL
jgi:hypothetical protein